MRRGVEDDALGAAGHGDRERLERARDRQPRGDQDAALARIDGGEGRVAVVLEARSDQLGPGPALVSLRTITSSPRRRSQRRICAARGSAATEMLKVRMLASVVARRRRGAARVDGGGRRRASSASR